MSKPMIRVYQPAEMVRLLGTETTRTGWYRKPKRRADSDLDGGASNNPSLGAPPSPPAA